MKLYKYVSARLWKKILQDKRVRFTQPAVFNDPFEMQPFYESIAGGAALEQLIEKSGVGSFDEVLFRAYSNLDDNLKALSSYDLLRSMSQPFFEIITQKLDDLAPMTNEHMSREINKHIGVLSLTRKRDNLLMWAHYADNHRGFVIEFDVDHDYFHQARGPKDEFGYLREVRYSPTRPSIVLMDADSTDIFLVKSMDWAYEEEYRMLRPLKDCDEKLVIGDEAVCLFSFPAECVTSILLGCRMPVDQRKEIIEFLRSQAEYSHTTIDQAVLDEREFKLNIVRAHN